MTLVVSRADVEHILSASEGEVLRALVAGMEAGYRELAEGAVRQHGRVYLRSPRDSRRRPPGLFSMSALLPRAGIMGTRLLALSGHTGGGDGLLILFDYPAARCLAIIDDSILHQYRTGAPAALATRYLARPDARLVACVGSSRIARGTLTMVCQVLPSVEAIRVYSPTESHRARFAAEMSAALGIEVRAVASPDEAVSEADVVITATDADRPVVPDRAIMDGVHVNVMARNELELATFRRSKLVTTSIAQLQAMDPPWHEPIPPEWFHCELADLVVGKATGRVSEAEVTVFIGSAPIAMWDVVAASVFYEAARKLGRGTEVEIAS
jgi:alanine dehydrogenase